MSKNSHFASLPTFSPYLVIIAAFVVGVTSSSLRSQELKYEWTNFVGMPGGYGNTNGVAGNARFFGAQGSATDQWGNIYVADTENHLIRKITPLGVVGTLAGTPGVAGSDDGAGSVAKFRLPRGLTVDSSGNVYVADTGNQTIRKVSPSGMVSTLAGRAGFTGRANGLGSNARFNEPTDITVGFGGDLFVCDQANQRICRITPAGLVSQFYYSASMFMRSSILYHNASGICYSAASDLLYVADTRNNVVYAMGPAGYQYTVGDYGLSGSEDGTGTSARFSGPLGVAADAAGNIYVADTGNSKIRRITPAGVVTTWAGTGQLGFKNGSGSTAQFQSFGRPCVDGFGQVFVPDVNMIRKIAANKTVSTFAGALANEGAVNASGANARFKSPLSMARDAAGNFYVADTVNHVIRKVTAAGAVTTFVGSFGQPGTADGNASTARLSAPGGIAVAPDGTVYVSEPELHRLRKITPAGVVSTFAGSSGNWGAVNGTGTAARFNYPSGLAVDASGNIIVADTWNHAIRMITPAGAVSTIAGSLGNFGSSNGTGAGARFFSPAGVAVDSGGNVFVAENGGDRIRRISAAGTVTTLAGTYDKRGFKDGIGTAALFDACIGIAVDAAGTVYVADTSNHAIRRITAGGVVTTIGGIGTIPGFQSGIDDRARFVYPSGIMVDPAGVLYVVDSRNNRISKGRLLSPPVFTSQPPSQVRFLGSFVTLSATLDGVPNAALRWFKNGRAIPWSDSSSLIFPSLSYTDAASYFVTANNGIGKATSNVAKLAVVNGAASVKGVKEGATLKLRLESAGTGLTYQWKHGQTLLVNNNRISGTTRSTLEVKRATAADAGTYTCEVSLGASKVTSGVFTVVLVSRPEILTQPASRMAKSGQSVTFTATATGAPLEWQWLKNGRAISGATSSSYTLPIVQPADAARYSVKVSNAAGSVVSAIAYLGVVVDSPKILAAQSGKSTRLAVLAYGDLLSFTWRRVGGTLPADRFSGEQTKTMTLSLLEHGDTATYICDVTGPGGPTTGGTHHLRVYVEAPTMNVPINLPGAMVGVEYTFQVPVSTDSKRAPTSYSASGLPPGLKIDRLTGLISGRPVSVARDPLGYKVTLGAANVAGRTSAQTRLVVSSLPVGGVGSFIGSLPRHNLSNNLGGLFDLNVTKRGSYTGRVTLGASRYPIKGNLTITMGNPVFQGECMVSRGRALPPLRVQFPVNSTTGRITAATISDGGQTQTFNGYRNPWASQPDLNPVYTGYHTFVLNLNTEGDRRLPSGNGYGSFKVTSKGALRLVGKLSDGTSTVMSSQVSSTGELAVFASLYRGKGSLLGTPVLNAHTIADLDDNTFGGQLSWSRPRGLEKERLYAEGFGPLSLQVFGGRYLPPSKGRIVMGLSDVANNARLIFINSQAGEPSPLPDISLKIRTNGTVALPPKAENLRRTTLKVNPRTGQFQGRYTLVDQNPLSSPTKPTNITRRVTYQGMIIEDGAGQAGWGYFLQSELPQDGVSPTTKRTTAILSGQVILDPVAK